MRLGLLELVPATHQRKILQISSEENMKIYSEPRILKMGLSRNIKDRKHDMIT